MYSFSQSLRAELANSQVTVVEIIPPAVNTNLGGTGLHDDGVPLDQFAGAAMVRWEMGKPKSAMVRRIIPERRRATSSQRYIAN